MKPKKLGLIGKLILGAGTIISAFTGSTNAGNLEVRNCDLDNLLIQYQAVRLFDNMPDGGYMPSQQSPALISYFKNFADEKLTIKGTDPTKFEKNRIYLEATNNVPSGTLNRLKLKFLDNAGYETRNIVLKQDPNNTNADPNTYDAFNLTQGGQVSVPGYIYLPPITNPQNGVVYANWDVISTNYADNNFDGNVNMLDFFKLAGKWNTSGHNATDNWAEFTDINRDGNVDLTDLMLFSEQWLWDGNTSAPPLTLNFDGIDILDKRFSDSFRKDAAVRFYSSYKNRVV